MQKMLIVDSEKCTGCRLCEAACSAKHDGISNPLRSRIHIMKVDNDRTIVPIVCSQCEEAPCIDVCPTGARYRDVAMGRVLFDYDRCIGCRFCTVACPYGVRFFNWATPEWEGDLKEHITPDRIEGDGISEGPTPRPVGVVEKCTFCIHRLAKARIKAKEENREIRSDDYIPACVQTCTAKARFFGDLDDPESTVTRLVSNTRAFRLQEDVGTHPKVIYLREG